MRRVLLSTLATLALVALASVALAKPVVLDDIMMDSLHAGGPIYGEAFGVVYKDGAWHNYVTFRIDPPHLGGNWRVEGPAPLPQLPGGTNPTPWPQTSPNYVQAGFRWFDPKAGLSPQGWLPITPYLFLKPSDFHLYPK